MALKKKRPGLLSLVGDPEMLSPGEHPTSLASAPPDVHASGVDTFNDFPTGQLGRSNHD